MSVTLAFEILAKDKASKEFDNVGTSVDNVGGKLGGLGGKFSTFAKTAGLALGGVAVGAAVLGKGFVDAATESQKVSKQTEAVLKSMGDGAGLTADQIATMSEKLAMQSGIDDELIQSGQNVLLTFGKVQNKVGKGNKIFDRATEAALNMSVALGTDLQGANIQVGKALNDPIKGITALSRAGVSFTQKQKDQIKAMVAYGDTVGAQKLILSELENQFGGSAEAQATAGEKLSVVWGNFQEQMGEKLLPVVTAVAGFMADKLPAAMETVGRFLTPVTDAISAFWSTLTTGFTEDEGTWIERTALFLRDTAGPAIKGFVDDALTALSNWWDSNGDNITGFFATLGTALGNIAEPVGAWLWETALPALQSAGEWMLENETTLPLVLGAVAGGFAAWAFNAGLAAIASWAAIAPLIPFIAVGAAAAGIYFLLADRGDGWLDVLIRTALAVWAIGSQIVGFFQTLWRWAKKAYEVMVDVFNKVEDIIGLADRIPLIGGNGTTGFGLGDAIEGTGKAMFPWTGLFGDDGGVIPGPRGAPRLVMGHAGETMIPTHKAGVFDAVGEDQLLELRRNNALLSEQNGILRGMGGGSWRATAAVMG